MNNKKSSFFTKKNFTRHFLVKTIRTQLFRKNTEDILRRLRLLRPWSWEVELVPKNRRGFYDRITFTVLFSFSVSFIIARTFAYLVTFSYIPNIFIEVRGVHIHHFIYGFIALAIAGFLSLISFSPKNKLWLALLYGMGLGLAADEAGQWLRLQDDYWVRQSYDAVIIILLILLFIIYLPRYLHFFHEKEEHNNNQNTLPKQKEN